ncbi:hypothetical protein O4H48_16675, partial [Rhodobacteraceae bacterium G21628-S1]|nr:hypothetical protein [Rhodobacteraceae bacterium G21628-S1]
CSQIYCDPIGSSTSVQGLPNYACLRQFGRCQLNCPALMELDAHWMPKGGGLYDHQQGDTICRHNAAGAARNDV